MKNYMKRMASIMLAMIVAFGMVFASIGEVKAASSDYISLPNQMWAYNPTNYVVGVYKMDSDKEYKITKVTSSNDSIIKIEKNTYDKKTTWYVQSKKAGTATVKVTYKKNGKSKTLSTKIKVRKYPSEIKSLSVNGKKISISKHKYQFNRSFSGTSVKIKMALKSGWKITSVDGQYYKNGEMKHFTVKKSQITKGTKISFPKKYDMLNVWIYMENKNGDMINYGVVMYRN